MKKSQPTLLAGLLHFLRILPIAASLICCINTSSYGTTVAIGAGTSTQRYPLNYYYGYARSASIYTSAEVGNTASSVNITSIGFYCATALNTGPTVIYLRANGSTTAESATTWATKISGATNSYSGTPAVGTAGTYRVITLTTPFNLASGQNLEVMVECNYTGTGNGASTGNACRYTTATNAHQYWEQDNSAPTGSGTVSSSRPNIQLVYTSCTPPAVPGAITGTTPVCGLGSQSYSISTVAGATSYIWSVSGGGTVGSNSTAGGVNTVSINWTAASGPYTISVTASNGTCASTAQTKSVTVYSNNVTASATATNQTSCNNGSGSIALTRSGGSGSYGYLWSNTAATQNISSLVSGTYTVTVSDLTCPSFTTVSASATVTAPWTAAATAGTAGCTTQVIATPVSSTTTLFSENFESYTTGLITSSTSQWRDYTLYDPYGAYTYWAMNSCNALSGSRSMGMNYYDGFSQYTCDYDELDNLQDISYNINAINATAYTNINLSFKWLCVGESSGSNIYDYMQVVYSFNGTTWTALPTKYYAQASTQNASVSIPALNGTSFYIGFMWVNDGSTWGTPVSVDDIVITGDKVYSYSWSDPVGASYNSSNTISNPYVDKAGTYTVGVTSAGCTSTAAVAVSVSSQSSPPTSISGTTAVCSGVATTLTTNGGSLGTGATDIWYTGSATEVFDQSWDKQPYGTPNTTVNSFTNGILNVTSTSNDPMIDMSGLGSFNPSTYKNIHIRYRVTAGTGGMAEIFFYNSAHNYAVGGESATGALISDGAWHVLNIDMTQDPDYTANGNILGWRFDWASNSGVTMDIDFIGLGDGVIIDHGTSTTVSPAATTTYYTNKKGACNNTSAVSQVVTINPAPTASVSYVSCPGTNGNTTVKIAGSGGTAPYTYQLNSGGYTSSNKFAVANASAQSYYVKDNNGCPSSVLSYTAPYATPTSIASSTTTANGCTCTNENRDVYLTNGPNVVMVVNDNNNDLGTITATLYQHGSPVMITGTRGTGQMAALQRNWVVNASTQPTTSITLKFPYTSGELTALQTSAATTTTTSDNITSAADLKATRYKGPNEDGTYNTAGYTVLQVLSQSGSGTLLGNPYVSVNTTGTSEYWLHGDANGSPLPVKLISFTANAVDESYIRLDWTTASEINNKGFDIERSTDGVSFEKIGWIDGHGNSNQQIDYSYNDKTVVPNSIYYYRLKQIDVDGVYEYSNIVSGVIIGTNGFVVESLRPNPANNKVTVQVVSLADQNATISVTDMLGREVSTQAWQISEGFNGTDIDLTAFASGTYNVVVKSQNQYFTKKLVVSR